MVESCSGEGKHYKDKEYVIDRLLEEMRGRSMEDIILLEAASDMLVNDRSEHSFEALEIKPSRKVVPEQIRHFGG